MCEVNFKTDQNKLVKANKNYNILQDYEVGEWRTGDATEELSVMSFLNLGKQDKFVRLFNFYF